MHLQARDLKDIKRGNQVKSSKRQDLEETGFNEGTDENATGLGQVGHKRPRIDYSVFRTDVARNREKETDRHRHRLMLNLKYYLLLYFLLELLYQVYLNLHLFPNLLQIEFRGSP